ncbi:unnamed protein product [Rotaria magnacalcarata]|uniref:Meckelin n=5 Tax=Rotaria magnacalcarata TaxID=392030 RepID=A0A816MMJ5_9BILA|nr:unnamed protein product [Rotaria magnacalcarata]CAF1496988.1 unnamed protein product [Rotaria magnacalcarata]CAF1989288.1 unnamed protein product [Rotaria magnacalcarata]
MSLLESLLLYFLPLLISLSIVSPQTSTYTAYRTSFLYKTSCTSDQYFDVALLQCSPCPVNAQQKSDDSTKCECINDNYYYGVNQGGGSLLCILCGSNYVRSIDGFGCITNNISCDSTSSRQVKSEAALNGDLYTSVNSSSASQPRIGNATCVSCQDGTWSNQPSQRCTQCASVTPRLGQVQNATIACCNTTAVQDGLCLRYIDDGSLTGFLYQNMFKSPTTSVFFQQHLRASFFLCRMNLNMATAQAPTRQLLSNATACQLLGNIAAMQFYYNLNGYAYYFYDTYIWNPPVSPSFWTISSNRTSIPFLAYPSTYFQDIISSTYNWIPATYNQNDLLRIKLAKYSPTGNFLGLFDAFDTYMQLCGGGYTDGQAAFTFGTQFKKACNIRADALWNSTLYETAFFDPYVVLTRNGTDYFIPCPVVILNYQSTTGSNPNRNSDESAWSYNRRFFLLDRISGVTTTTSGTNELININYATTIKILTTLTSGASYIQPPVIIVGYSELALTDIGKGTIVQVSFESSYRMDFSQQIMNIWIAAGVLAFLGVVLAFFRTTVWYSRRGDDNIDLAVIGKFSVYISNILATVFFIVLAGVSVWWLIFYKRQNRISLVLPTDALQASFTALVVLAFSLKTIDILHLVFRQAMVDIFFMDWEKPKAGIKDDVSIWRTYFVANEYQEIQAFRRINVTFQIFFVLFLLKVINLENVATMEPGVNLFPPNVDYQPGYSSILRVGIAFSMWLATAIVQYLIYVIFYQRFVEDKIINFIDLCSVSNISVFIFTDNLYGYYIHGLSPHGTTDVNIKDMTMNLERESNQLSGKRGLQAKSDEQTFIVQISRNFRGVYTEARNRYHIQRSRQKENAMGEKQAENLMAAYQNLNGILCAFINHSLRGHEYTIRERTFQERVLNYEFLNRNPYQTLESEQSIFFVDNDRNLIRAIFAGHENSLFIWNMATFIFIDYFAFNYVLAGIVTYILNFIAIKICMSFGRKNLSTKTLIPKNFLM